MWLADHGTSGPEVHRGLGNVQKKGLALKVKIFYDAQWPSVTSEEEQHLRRLGVLCKTVNMGPKAAMDEGRVR